MMMAAMLGITGKLLAADCQIADPFDLHLLAEKPLKTYLVAFEHSHVSFTDIADASSVGIFQNYRVVQATGSLKDSSAPTESAENRDSVLSTGAYVDFLINSVGIA